jgi:hypothetical protein
VPVVKDPFVRKGAGEDAWRVGTPCPEFLVLTVLTVLTSTFPVPPHIKRPLGYTLICPPYAVLL